MSCRVGRRLPLGVFAKHVEDRVDLGPVLIIPL
jgi:hypothetical protein